ELPASLRARRHSGARPAHLANHPRSLADKLHLYRLHSPTVELRHLRSIVALAEERHFGRAALRLAITQPALSQQLTQLEANLGARLFERHPRVDVTPVGAALVDHARRILAS